MEAEYREATNLLRSPVPSVHHSTGGSEDGGKEDGKDWVSEMEIQNVEDVDNELYDQNLIGLDTCKGDPPPDPKGVRCSGPPKIKAPPPIPPSQSVDRAALIAAIQNGVISPADVEFAVSSIAQLALSSSSGQTLSRSACEVDGENDPVKEEGEWTLVQRKTKKSSNVKGTGNRFFPALLPGFITKSRCAPDPKSKGGPGPGTILGSDGFPGSIFDSGPCLVQTYRQVFSCLRLPEQFPSISLPAATW